MRKPVILLGLATVMIAAFVILRQQQIDLEAVRGHVDALAAWREPNAAAVVAGFIAAHGDAGTQLARIGILSPPLLLSFALLGLFPWIARMIVKAQKDRTEDDPVTDEERA